MWEAIIALAADYVGRSCQRVAACIKLPANWVMSARNDDDDDENHDDRLSDARRDLHENQTKSKTLLTISLSLSLLWTPNKLFNKPWNDADDAP